MTLLAIFQAIGVVVTLLLFVYFLLGWSLVERCDVPDEPWVDCDVQEPDPEDFA